MGFREVSRDIQGLVRIIEALAQEHAKTRGVQNGILDLLKRGFFGRLRWLIFGS